MLRISKMTDYALLITGRLALIQVGVLSATLLAESLHLNVPTVSKILKILSDANLVSALRGVEGGYSLARSASTIKVLDVVIAMEGEIAVTECCESSNLCLIDPFCTLKENWKIINKMMYSLLDKWTIQDMLKPL